MRKLFIIAAMALGLFAVGCDDDFTPPAQLSTSFYDTYPNAVDVEWEREHGHIVAEFKLPGVSNDCEAWFKNDGTWVLTTYDIKVSELPEAVLNAFQSEYGAATPIDGVEYIEKSNGDKQYVIEFETFEASGEIDVFLSYSPDGKLLNQWVNIYYDYIYDLL
jgi:hypothetical protein